jgi:hypothetical protein
LRTSSNLRMEKGKTALGESPLQVRMTALREQSPLRVRIQFPSGSQSSQATAHRGYRGAGTNLLCEAVSLARSLWLQSGTVKDLVTGAGSNSPSGVLTRFAEFPASGDCSLPSDVRQPAVALPGNALAHGDLERTRKSWTAWRSGMDSNWQFRS